MKRNWIITCRQNGFTYKIFVNAIEDRLLQYMQTELPDAINYTGATEQEIEAARVLHLPIYLY